MRIIRIPALVFVVVLLLAGCASGGGDPLQEGGGETAAEGGGDSTIVVGSFDFTESIVLAHLYAQVLQDAGATTAVRPNLGARDIVFPSLESGEIDLIAEYTGALNSYLTQQEEPDDTDVDALVASIEENLPDGLTLLEPSQAEDQDALAVTQETADRYGLTTVSDLAPVAGELVAGGPPEEETRRAGLSGLREVYGIEFREFRPLDAGGPLTTEALNSGQIQVGRVFTTQSAIQTNDWVVLEDDKGLIPSEAIVPLIREEAATPEVTEALNTLSQTLTTEDMIEMNGRVDEDQEDPEIVAQEYLEEAGLIGG